MDPPGASVRLREDLKQLLKCPRHLRRMRKWNPRWTRPKVSISTATGDVRFCDYHRTGTKDSETDRASIKVGHLELAEQSKNPISLGIWYVIFHTWYFFKIQHPCFPGGHHPRIWLSTARHCTDCAASLRSMLCCFIYVTGPLRGSAPLVRSVLGWGILHRWTGEKLVKMFHHFTGETPA